MVTDKNIMPDLAKEQEEVKKCLAGIRSRLDREFTKLGDFDRQTTRLLRPNHKGEYVCTQSYTLTPAQVVAVITVVTEARWAMERLAALADQRFKLDRERFLLIEENEKLLMGTAQKDALIEAFGESPDEHAPYYKQKAIEVAIAYLSSDS
jgi:hypothetical protein